MAAIVRANSGDLGLITRMSNWAENYENKKFWDIATTCLHGEPNETKKVELEETNHHLIVLIHLCMSPCQGETNSPKRDCEPFMAGLAPTAWNIAHLNVNKSGPRLIERCSGDAPKFKIESSGPPDQRQPGGCQYKWHRN